MRQAGCKPSRKHAAGPEGPVLCSAVGASSAWSVERGPARAIFSSKHRMEATFPQR